MDFIQTTTNNPLISCYTVFNKYSTFWLKECVLAVKDIIYSNYEYVFVIYGQNNEYDPILDILNLMDGRVRLFYYPDSENFIDAITFAINKCRGEFLTRCDADDILMPNALNVMLEEINKHDASMVIPMYVELDAVTGKQGPKVIEGKINNIVSHALIERDKYNYVKYIPGQTFRDGVSLMKTFNEYGFKVVYLDKVCFIHRINEKSLTFDQVKVIEMDKKIKEMKNG